MTTHALVLTRSRNQVKAPVGRSLMMAISAADARLSTEISAPVQREGMTPGEADGPDVACRAGVHADQET